MFLSGTTTHGHYQIELACQSCRTPFEGVRQDACLKCHAQELETANDSHRKGRFRDPRHADLLVRLDALACVTCHTEHREEITTAMGVTVPEDFCFHCHAGIASERKSHTGMPSNTCATAGCHNYHDNRALYEDFLVQHHDEPESLGMPIVAARNTSEPVGSALSVEQHDAPTRQTVDAGVLAEWSSTAHAASGVNCSHCHAATHPAAGEMEWIDTPAHEKCASCHQHEAAGFLADRHGMRLAASLPPMVPSLARLPMNPNAMGHELGCTSCHGSHDFNTIHAAVDACLTCHTDTHSQAYEASTHFTLWQAEVNGRAAAGSGVSCATCHLPREAHRQGGAERVLVQHNQNANLRPNEKMIRDVCMHYHGLAFLIDALADSALIERNFHGRPSPILRASTWPRDAYRITGGCQKPHPKTFRKRRMIMANNAIGVFILGGCLAAVLVGCSGSEPTRDTTPVITPKTMADALYVVMESNRTIYTRTVVNRLHNEEHLIKTSEHWKDDKALPLPSQMFRMGAEMAAEKTDVFRYALLSLWPINKKNGPKTEVETHGLTAVAEKPEPYYAEEELGGKKFFTAIYPDVVVAARMCDLPQQSQRQPSQ